LNLAIPAIPVSSRQRFIAIDMSCCGVEPDGEQRELQLIVRAGKVVDLQALSSWRIGNEPYTFADLEWLDKIDGLQHYTRSPLTGQLWRSCRMRLVGFAASRSVPIHSFFGDLGCESRAKAFSSPGPVMVLNFSAARRNASRRNRRDVIVSNCGSGVSRSTFGSFPEDACGRSFCSVAGIAV
jgi:hypothetical protein